MHVTLHMSGQSFKLKSFSNDTVTAVLVKPLKRRVVHKYTQSKTVVLENCPRLQDKKITMCEILKYQLN